MSEEVKHYKDLENQIFNDYYYSNYLPSTIGGSPNTKIMHLLQAIQSALNLTVSATEISRDWINDVTWFTKRLEDLFQLPRFRDETDREYYNRLLALVDAHQDEATIQVAINTLIENAIASLSSITFTYQTSQGNWGDDAVPASYSFFWNNSPADVWGDANTSLRAVMKVLIQFANNLQSDLIAHYRLDGDVLDSSGRTETIDTSVDNITFTSGSPDTISRGSGDWTTILEVGQNITLDGSEENDSRFQIASLTASTLTLTSNTQLNNESMTTGTLTIDIEHNRHGTNSGVTFDYAKWNYGGYFDKSLDANILLPSMGEWSAFSIAMVYKLDSLASDDSTFRHAVNLREAGTNYRINIYQDTADDKLVARLFNASGNVVVRSNNALEIDKEYLIIMTWDGSEIELFIDNVSQGTNPISGILPTFDKNYIGTYNDATNFMDGYIDNIMIWEREITSAERSLLENYKTTYEYWSAPMNYTKIAAMIDLYRPPGIDFELDLSY